MTLEDWVSNNGCGMTVWALLMYTLSLRELILMMIFIVIK